MSARRTEKGFATILGLCLVLIVALVANGIRAAQMNHTYETENFGAEFDLQNAADSAVVAAADKVLSGKVTLPKKVPPYRDNRRDFQCPFEPPHPFTSESVGDITVETYGEEANIHPYEISYKGEDGTDASANNIANKLKPDRLLPAYVFFSVAQATNPRTGATIYRRAFAYVLQGDTTIHFMEVPTSSYRFGS